MLDSEYYCAYCGSTNETTVDESAGRKQSYVEDCQTCCSPNILHVEIEFGDSPTVYIDAEPESGASS